MSTDPATKQDVQDAIADLKQWMLEREIGWLKWVVGFQLTYFAITIASMFFIAEHVR
jgi:hypothetical protein